jgi:hypothetical protein
MAGSQANPVVDDSQAEDQECGERQDREKPTRIPGPWELRRGAEQANTPAGPGRQPYRDTSAERDRSAVEFSPSIGSVQEPTRHSVPPDGRDGTQADPERCKWRYQHRNVEHDGIPAASVTQARTDSEIHGDS